MPQKMGSSTIVKLGIVTPDIEATAAAFGRLFEIEAPVVHRAGEGGAQRPEAHRRYRGQDAGAIPLHWALVELTPLYLMSAEQTITSE